MASDSWRYPWTMMPDYMGPGTPVEQYQKRRADLVTGPATTTLPTARPSAPPAVTQNAVATANEMTVPTSRQASTAATPPGQVSKLSPDAGQPYPGVENITSQIARRDSAGVDFGLPRMQQQYQQVPTGGGGGGGLFSPSLMSAIQNYHDLSTKADDGSLSGAWRSRGLAKQRDRLIAGAVAAQNADAGMISAGASALGANAAMMRATNEPALEGMRNFVTARGQDLNYDLGTQQTATQRYGIDTTRDTAQRRMELDARGQELDFERFRPMVQRMDLGNRAYQAGDTEAANTLWSGGAHPQQPKFTAQEGVTGYSILDQRSGRFNHIPTADLPQFRMTPPMEAAARKRHEEDVRRGQ